MTLEAVATRNARASPKSTAIRIVLLAAGSGSRFGGDKLEAPLSDGTPLVLATARGLLAAGGAVLAVVRGARDRDGQGAARLLRALPDIDSVPCAGAAQGIGHSIACGVRHSADANGWLLALGDMPFVRPETIRRLLDALAGGASLVAPCHGGRRGHPVGFSRRWRSSLLRLSGDIGARRVLAANPDALMLIDVEDAGVLLDVDRPADLARGA